MADQEVKFTEEEMLQINELREAYVNLQNTFGQLKVNRIRFEQQMTDFDALETTTKRQFLENQDKERGFVNTINKKYGDGNLDLNSGVFTPAPPAAETPVVGEPSAASAVKPDKTL